MKKLLDKNWMWIDVIFGAANFGIAFVGGIN